LVTEQQKVDFISEIIASLSDLNRRCLDSLLALLKLIVEQQVFNLMSSYNVAVCLAPCLFRPKEFTPKEFMLTGYMIITLQLMIDHYSHLFKPYHLDNFTHFPNKTSQTFYYSKNEAEEIKNQPTNV
jgi:hypothetical protein